ncbi:MAG: hypothetical protein IPK82_14270 [Polyangiaceae bacterium]|nr:hypothetical protein [Polyangiaceae bacterium]
MNITARLSEIERLSTAGKVGAAEKKLAEFMGEVMRKPKAQREAAFQAILARIPAVDSRSGGYFALACGSLIESGLSAEPLAAAVAAPLLNVMRHALRFAEGLRDVEQAEGQDMIEIGALELPRLFVDNFAKRDAAAVISFEALDTWYLPAVASLTRETRHLAAAQQNADLISAASTLSHLCTGGFWLNTLFSVSLNQPFVVLIPEISEAYSMTLNGISDVGQLMVLLAESLADALAKIGASGVLPKSVLQVMSGVGPQRVENVAYTASFHLYPWRAVDPSDMMPKDGRFMWTAPGGTGNHSLPPDFAPSSIERLEGTHVLSLVGPNAPNGVRFSREIGASRAFEALTAEVKNVSKLTAAETQHWNEILRRKLSS